MTTRVVSDAPVIQSVIYITKAKFNRVRTAYVHFCLYFCLYGINVFLLKCGDISLRIRTQKSTGSTAVKLSNKMYVYKLCVQLYLQTTNCIFQLYITTIFQNVRANLQRDIIRIKLRLGT